MNLGPAAGATLAQQVLDYSKKLKKTEVWLTPPSVTIPAVAGVVKSSPVKFGSQNVYSALSGAFTGEVCSPMLKEVGCSFALTGHSERRHVFGEPNSLVIDRTIGALKGGLQTIFCVGETLKERTLGRIKETVRSQLAPLFREDFTAELSRNLVIAYEPVWAIGTGHVASREQIAEAFELLSYLWSRLTSAALPPILYGGSVDPNNISSILSMSAVGGCLVGGASIDFEKFRRLIDACEAR